MRTIIAATSVAALALLMSVRQAAAQESVEQPAVDEATPQAFFDSLRLREQQLSFVLGQWSGECWKQQDDGSPPTLAALSRDCLFRLVPIFAESQGITDAKRAFAVEVLRLIEGDYNSCYQQLASTRDALASTRQALSQGASNRRYDQAVVEQLRRMEETQRRTAASQALLQSGQFFMNLAQPPRSETWFMNLNTFGNSTTGTIQKW